MMVMKMNTKLMQNIRRLTSFTDFVKLFNLKVETCPFASKRTGLCEQGDAKVMLSAAWGLKFEMLINHIMIN